MKPKATKHLAIPQTADAHHEGDDRAWRVAQLAAVLAVKTSVLPRTDGRVTLMHHTRMVELEWAVEDAEYLLQAADRAASVAHAFELFLDADRYYSVSEIRLCFERASWKGLTSWASCENLLGEVLKSLTKRKENSDLPSPVPDSLPVPLPLADSPFWVPLEELVRKSKTKEKKKYRARSLFTMAKIFCREEFRSRLERPRKEISFPPT